MYTLETCQGGLYSDAGIVLSVVFVPLTCNSSFLLREIDASFPGIDARKYI